MDSELKKLLEMAKSKPMSSAEEREQLESFAYGNTNIENPLITKETISTAATRLAESHSNG